MNKYADIIESILIERENQNIKHPVLPKWFLSPLFDPDVEDMKASAEYQKADNDYVESIGEHSWYGILHEELYETFAETDLHKMRAEAIQLAALSVRMIETIDVMIDKSMQSGV
jgi:hypothetical protein